jgi:cytochrome c biogenesis protein CcmG/thiol:disulfide interchange protein DsbE
VARTAATRKGQRRRTSAAIAALVLVALFVGLLAYGIESTTRETALDERLAESRRADAPGFQLPVLAAGRLPEALERRLGPVFGDGRLDVDELRGTPFVLNFWASWCPPCRTETPRLQRAWRTSGERGVLLLGLNMQDVTSDARSFLRELRVTYPNVRDRSDEVAREWGVVALPETFFVDADGKVVGHVIGEIDVRQLSDGIRAARTKRPLGAQSGGDRRPTR